MKNYAAALIAAFLLSACGPSEEEKLAKKRKAEAEAAQLAELNAPAMRAAVEKFRAIPGIEHVEWAENQNFIVAAADNGQTWEPAAHGACRWIRSQGMVGRFRVTVLEASALLNRSWVQLASVGCN